MGLSYTGMSCFEMAMVHGWRRVPEPPARMMPLRFFMILIVWVIRQLCSYLEVFHAFMERFLPRASLQPEGFFQFAAVEFTELGALSWTRKLI